MIGQLIGQWIVVGIPVAGLCAMVWYIATWKAKPVLAAPAPLPKSQAELAEESRRYMRRQDIKDKLQVTLFFIALIPVGLILLALLVFAFTSDYTMSQMDVIAFLLVCILFNMGRK